VSTGATLAVSCFTVSDFTTFVVSVVVASVDAGFGLQAAKANKPATASNKKSFFICYLFYLVKYFAKIHFTFTENQVA
jgi:hypothetical protein